MVSVNDYIIKVNEKTVSTKEETHWLKEKNSPLVWNSPLYQDQLKEKKQYLI